MSRTSESKKIPHYLHKKEEHSHDAGPGPSDGAAERQGSHARSSHSLFLLIINFYKIKEEGL